MSVVLVVQFCAEVSVPSQCAGVQTFAALAALVWRVLWWFPHLRYYIIEYVRMFHYITISSCVCNLFTCYN